MLLYNKNQFEKHNLIEIKNNYIFDTSIEDIDYSLIIKKSNDKKYPYMGWPHFITLNNIKYIITENGLYDLKNKKITNKNINVKFSNNSLANNYFYSEKDNFFFKIQDSCLYYETIFLKYYKNRNKNPPIILFNDKQYFGSVFLIKFFENKYLYPLSSNEIVMKKEIYNCSLEDDNKCYIIEFIDNKWQKSNITYTKFKSLDNGIKFNKFIYTTFNFNIIDLFENIDKIIPSSFIFNKFFEKNNDKDFNFIINCIKKFGCDLSYKKALELCISNDLKEWKEYSYMSECYQNIFGDNPSPSTDLFHTIPITDTVPNIIYNPNIDSYIYYNRANIQQQCRYISVSFSKDLKEWTNNELIRLHPPFKFRRFDDNIYIPSIFLYESYYLGIWTFIDQRKWTISYQFYISKNGIDFYKINEFFKEKLNYQLRNIHLDDKNVVFIPNSFSVENNKFIFYSWIHNHKRNKDNLNKWSIRKDGFTSIKSIEENISSFLTKLVNIRNNKLIINFKTEEDGYIKVQLLDKSNNLIKGYDFHDCNLIMGDNCNYTIKWDNNDFISDKQVKIEVKLYKAEIFSFNCDEIYFFENEKKFDKIYYFYIEHTNYLNYGNLRDGINNSKCKVKDLKLDNLHAIELVGKPIYENKMTLVKQKIRLSNNEIITITLEDNSEKDECIKYKDFFENPYTKKGTSCAVFDIRLINSSDNEYIDSAEYSIIDNIF